MQDVRCHLEKARSVSNQIERATKKTDFSLPVATYGYKTWISKKKLQQSIQSFQMFAYRKILRISWTLKKLVLCIDLKETLQTKIIIGATTGTRCRGRARR